jgi:hypothetical protein
VESFGDRSALAGGHVSAAQASIRSAGRRTGIVPGDVTARAPETTTCLSCGYDLRAAGIDEKCPECGFAVRDSVAGYARGADRWAWKVRLGMLLMLLATPLLVASLLSAHEAGYMLLLNLPAPKCWAAPMVIMHRAMERPTSVIIIVGVLTNMFAMFLVTAPDQDREPAMALRRWLRVHAVAAVVVSWFIVAPQVRRLWLPGEGPFDEFFILAIAEIPGTTLLYLYIAQLARERLNDPQLARRAVNLLKGALPLQVFTAIMWSGVLRLEGAVIAVVVAGYAVAVVGIGLWALDLCLDFYRALGQIERNAARG